MAGWLAPAERLMPFAASRLFRKYASLLLGLVGSVLIGSATIEAWSSYHEHRDALLRLHEEKARGAAVVIDRFVLEIESQIGWTTHLVAADNEAALEARRFDILRLLRQAPSVTEVALLDAKGRERLRVSRLEMDVTNSGRDLSFSAGFTMTRAGGPYRSPVYFRKDTEPFMTLAVAGRGAAAGVTIAEVNLKFIWDVVIALKVGKGGAAYVVDRNGLLIAHPDIGLVLRKTDLSGLPHVTGARAIDDGEATSKGRSGVAFDWMGREVLTASAPVASTGWLVFVDLPTSEAFEPMRAALLRSGAIALGALGLAALAALWLVQRLAVPIGALAKGAERIGAGDLDHRIQLRTGDEIEELAESFNAMGAKLKDSYEDLEQRVETRTAELARSLEELSALAEIGRAVSSRLDLSHVLRTVVEQACVMAHSGGGAIYMFDAVANQFHLEAAHNMTDAHIAYVRAHPIRLGDPIVGDAGARRETVQVTDIRALPRSSLIEMLGASGIRAILAVPLLHQGQLIGALAVRRATPGVFLPETVRLIEAFAAQSATAVRNARLYAEVIEKSRQLQLASQHKSQFLANMSHELRTPLNAILGYAELMLDGAFGELPGEQRDTVERVERNGKHLLGLINEVLDLSKIEAGEMALTIEEYSLASLLSSTVIATEPLARQKGLALDVVIADGMPRGRGDARRLSQVLLNLIVNAIKFTDRGGVTIRAGCEGTNFRIDVQDTGPGISPAEFERIFEKFQQVDNTSTRNKGGTGLGLAIAREFVEMHGGTIAVSSAPGEGALFTVSIPVEVVAAHAATQSNG